MKLGTSQERAAPEGQRVTSHVLPQDRSAVRLATSPDKPDSLSKSHFQPQPPRTRFPGVLFCQEAFLAGDNPDISRRERTEEPRRTRRLPAVRLEHSESPRRSRRTRS